jgi:hypothetical protein
MRTECDGIAFGSEALGIEHLGLIVGSQEKEEQCSDQIFRLF